MVEGYLSCSALFELVFQMERFEVLTQLEVKLHPDHISYQVMVILREMKSGHPIAVLNCSTTFALSYSTGGRNYAIMGNSSTMDVLPMIGNASTVQDQEGEGTPEPTGSLLPYRNGGLGLEYPIQMDSTPEEQDDEASPEPTGPPSSPIEENSYDIDIDGLTPPRVIDTTTAPTTTVMSSYKIKNTGSKRVFSEAEINLRQQWVQPSDNPTNAGNTAVDTAAAARARPKRVRRPRRRDIKPKDDAPVIDPQIKDDAPVLA